MAGTESTVWRGTPVGSLPYHHGAAGSGADMETDATPTAFEQQDSVSDTLLLDDDPVDPDPPAPAPAPADANPDPYDSASDAAADPFQALFPPATGAPPDRTPSPDNPPECPDEAPENPLGPCAGLPVYIVCTYGTYTCICDWVHWMCAG